MDTYNTKSWLGFNTFLQQFYLEDTINYFNHKNHLYIEKDTDIRIVVNECKEDNKSMYLIDIVGDSTKSFCKYYFSDYGDVTSYILGKIRDKKLKLIIS